jgi:hypothetical protein
MAMNGPARGAHAHLRRRNSDDDDAMEVKLAGRCFWFGVGWFNANCCDAKRREATAVASQSARAPSRSLDAVTAASSSSGIDDAAAAAAAAATAAAATEAAATEAAAAAAVGGGE